ncbi:MAG: ribbon-helix-helix protein, CopG family [Candidatus Electrothrix sp. AUS1_2]|nr:ribbon-helix-helix protein, CopG family [Candidatus Electrothrix sp. AUS1_2]
MNTDLTVHLPKSLHEQIKQLAEAEGISIHQFLVTAAAEKMSALLTQSYLEREAAKGRRQDFDNVLRAVPDAEPEPHDMLT